jgi:hypothetical protein
MRFGSWRKKSEVERERKKLGERAEGNQLSGGGLFQIPVRSR